MLAPNLSESEWIILDNAKRGDIAAPEMCRRYEDLTPEKFHERAERLADLSYLDRVLVKNEPATYSLSGDGRDALKRREEAHRAEVIRNTGTWP